MGASSADAPGGERQDPAGGDGAGLNDRAASDRHGDPAVSAVSGGEPGAESRAGGSDAAPVEPEPASAAAVFSDGLAGARRYVALLADDGLRRGLIGPRERGRLWTRHVLNCALAAAAIPAGARVVDIGSGAGLPGIPLALARPDLRLDLVETLLRRTTFLDEAVTLLGLEDRVRVVRARAEEAVATVGRADVVTARAVAPLAKLARWAAPLLRGDGLFVALKGESAADEVTRDAAAAAAAGIVDLRVEVVSGEGLEDAAVTLVIGRKAVGGVGLRSDGMGLREASGGSRRRAGRERGGRR